VEGNSIVLVINSIVDNILDHSKLEANKMLINNNTFAPPRLMESVIRINRHLANTAGVEYLGYCDPNIPIELFGDSTKTTQILVNITSNGIKFSPHGSVFVKAMLEEMKDSKCKILFTCEDNGIGIKEEDLPKLFKPFEQVENPQQLEHKGWGLGLSICKEMAELLGGSLSIASEFGKGTVVSLRLTFDVIKADRKYTLIRPIQHKSIMIQHSSKRLCETIKNYLGFMAKPGDLSIFVNEETTNDIELLLLQTNQEAKVKAKETILLGETLDKTNHSVYIPLPVQALRLNTILCSVSHVHVTKDTGDTKPNSKVRKTRFSFPGKRVLVADDNTVIRMFAGKILSGFDMKYDLAVDGVEAYDLFQKNVYDIILLDAHMPNLDGFEVLKLVRSHPETSKNSTKCVVITGNNDAETIIRFQQLGVEETLIKPITMDTLGNVLGEVFK
jgi:CheY-like chemotaxis protein